MSGSVALQKLIFDTLVASAAVHAEVADRVYDNVPETRVYPYLSFGPTQEIQDDAECIDGEAHAFQIDVWDRSQGRLVKAKKINGIVKAALHDADLVLPDPYALSFIRVTSTRSFLDPDGITSHGVVTVEAMIEARS